MIDESACAESDCGQPVAVRLHIPGEENRLVCIDHGRARAQEAGVVGELLDR